MNLKTKIAFALVSLPLLFPVSAFAQTVTTTQTSDTAGTTSREERVNAVITKEAEKTVMKAEASQTKETNLKTRADNEIQRRITALTDLITRINKFKKLTADQKASFSTSIQTEITNLTTLKAKIDADTDSTTLKADVKSIVTDYRVFAFYIPQIRMLDTADRMLALADSMTIYTTKLDARITEASGNGKDVTLAKAALLDMQTKIADARTQAQSVITLVVALTPAGYPANKTTLQSAKATLMTAKKDLEAARKDGISILQALGVTVPPPNKTENPLKPEPSASPSPVTTQ